MASTTDNSNQLFSTYDTQMSSSSSSSPASSCSSITNLPEAQTSASSTRPKGPTVKLPYPVLCDRRDPLSVLSLLRKETQTTSKKIHDVTEQIEACEKNMASDHPSDIDRKSLKFNCVRHKKRLDALNKHERRVNLQIEYLTIKTEIKGLEDEYKHRFHKRDSMKNMQIDFLLRKLRQKLDQMKLYMRERNDEMKRTNKEKRQSSSSHDAGKQLSNDRRTQQRSSSPDLNRKRPLSLTSNSHSNKHLKSTTHNLGKLPVVRLVSRSSSHPTKSHPIQTPAVRFVTKTTDFANTTNNSTSPTTPASSSSTLSSPLVASTSTGDANSIQHFLRQNASSSTDEDDESDHEFNLKHIFHDHSYVTKTHQTIQI